MPKVNHCYKIQLWKSSALKGHEETLVIADFQPAKVDGFGIVSTGHNSKLYEEKYGERKQ